MNKTLPFLIITSFFGLYSIINILLGDYTPVMVASALFLLITFPQWASLGILGVFLFRQSAFQLPIPGQPDLWHFCGFLGIFGGIMQLCIGRCRILGYRINFGIKFILTLCLILCVYIFFIALIHEISLKEFLTTVGGRQYVKYALFYLIPIFAFLNTYSLKKGASLLKWGYFLGLTFLIIEIILIFTPQFYSVTNLFFKGAHDALSYSQMGETIGYQRFSGVSTAATAIAILLLVTRRSKKPRFPAMLFWSIIILLFSLTLLSGARSAVPKLPLAILAVFWMSRKLTLPIICGFSLLAISLLGSAYLFYDKLPGAAQRALTILPGLDDKVYEYGLTDTIANDGGRSEIRHFSWKIFHNSNLITGIGYKDRALVDFRIGSGDPITFLKATAKYDVGILTPILIIGIGGGVIIIILMISLLFISLKALLSMREKYYDDIISKIFAVVTILFFYKLVYITVMNAYHINFFEVPALQATLLIFQHLYFQDKRNQELAIA